MSELLRVRMQLCSNCGLSGLLSESESSGMDRLTTMLSDTYLVGCYCRSVDRSGQTRVTSGCTPTLELCSSSSNTHQWPSLACSRKIPIVDTWWTEQATKIGYGSPMLKDFGKPSHSGCLKRLSFSLTVVSGKS